jgi:uncharacterized membrane protein YfcA
MNFELVYLGYIILGFAVGSMMGLTGMGGAVLMTPVLILMGIQPLVAVGSDLVFMAVTKFFGTVFHRKQGNLDILLGLNLVIGAIPALILANMIFLFLSPDSFNRYIGFVLAALLLIIAGLSFLKTYKMEPGHNKYDPRCNRNVVKILIVGFIVGITVMFTSVGGGVLAIFSLVFLLKLEPRVVVGTSLFLGFFLSVMGGGSHFLMGNVDFGLVGFLLVGSIAGIYLGTILMKRIPTEKLKLAFNFIILGLGIATLISAIYHW